MHLADDKYLILTGGAGFIGSGILRLLNDHGFTNIIVVDHFDDTEKWSNLVGKKFVHALDRSQLFSWIESREDEVSAIIHLGACSSTVEKDSAYLLENNYQYTLHLAELALEHDIRFIYASSAATYGDGTLGFSDDHDLLDTYRPLNMYGFSKHMFDLWAKREGVLDQLVGLKYFNVFGPNEYHKGRMSSFVYKMLPVAMKEKELTLFQSSDPEQFGDGEQSRDFLYVKDAAAMTIAFLHNNLGGIYNIGRGKAETWNELAQSMIAALDHEVNIRYIPMPEDLIGKYQNYTCADMTKLKTAGMKEAQYDLKTACRDYIHEYLLKGAKW